MLSVLKVAIANIKKKKGQNLLIALIIFSMALVFSTSIVILNEINKPFERMFNSQKGSHLSLIFSNRVHNAAEAAAWWKSQGEIESVQVLNQYWLKDQVYFKGEKLNTLFMMTEMPAGTQYQDMPRVVEGEKKEKPGTSEMWLPIAVADSNKIKVGDVIEIPTGNGTEKLKVSALVADPIYCSNLLNPTRVWIAPGTLASMFPLTNLNNVSMGIRFKDYSKSAELMKKFDSFLKQPFSGVKVDYETIHFANLFTYQLIGTILLILSVIIILITLFIIYFTITNAVLSEYKTIGILKSQGFSRANIVSVFSIQYLLIALVFIPLGILLSKFSSNLLLKSLIRAIGLGSGNESIFLPGLITFLVLTLLILTVACVTSLKAGRVKPAEAIRYGAPEKDYSRGPSIPAAALKKLSIPMILGIKDMISNKRQSLFLMAVTAVTVMVIAFSLNLNYSMGKMTDNSAYWGFENNDITITKQGARFVMTHDDIMEKLKKESNIDIIVPYSFSTNCSIVDEKTNTSKSIMGSVYDGDLNSIGMINIEGRHPKNENEVSLAITTSKELNKKPGDIVDIYIDGVKMNLLVTGVYQSIGNGGHGFRIQAAAVKNANPTFEPNTYFIILKDKADIKGYIKKLENKLGTSVTVQGGKEAMEDITKGVVSSIGVTVFMIMLIFSVVCFITIFNFTSLNINHNKKNYGIYKSTGMASNQIRLSILYRFIFITLAGLLAGIPTGLLGGPRLLNLMFSSMGIVEFPFSMSVYITALVVPISLAIAAASAWIPSRKIVKLNPRTLIVE